MHTEIRGDLLSPHHLRLDEPRARHRRETHEGRAQAKRHPLISPRRASDSNVQCTQDGVSRSTSARRVQDVARSISSVLYNQIADSISASPTEPMESVIPDACRASVNASDVYWIGSTGDAPNPLS